MSSWYSNILTTTTSRISTLRSTLLGGDADGDTDDDTHVCRVLRAYYAEKGRAFPPWLPPDPKAAQAPTPTPVVASKYGGLTPSASASVNSTGGGGGLSSLWDNSGKAAGAAAPPNSLRAPRLGASPFRNRNSDPAAGGDPGPAAAAAPQGQGRPGLPSQRLGSYQSTASAPAAAPVPSAGATAQGKLRNMFGGGGGGGSAGNSRSNSPALAGGGRAPPPPPAGAGGYGGSSGGGGRPFVAANAPWQTDEPAYGGGGGGGSAGHARPGLPSNPRRGLPGGPRMR